MQSLCTGVASLCSVWALQVGQPHLHSRNCGWLVWEARRDDATLSCTRLCMCERSYRACRRVDDRSETQWLVQTGNGSTGFSSERLSL